MVTTTIIKSEKIPSLDGLRCIAILMVVLSHMAITDTFPASWGKFIGWFIDGRIGVEIFFVISGFLITYLLLVEKQAYGAVNLRKFYIRRVLRIFPAFYVYLLFLCLLNVLHFVSIKWTTIASSALYVYNLDFAEYNWLVNHSWSLGVEEQFYLILPCLLALLSIRTIKWVFIAGLCVGCFARSFHYKFTELSPYILSGFFMHIDFLITGTFIAFQYHFNRDMLNNRFKHAGTWLPICSLLVVTLMPLIEYHPVFDVVTIPLCRSITSILIGVSLCSAVLNKESIVFSFLNNSILCYIGRLSYSIYIWQQFFITGDNAWYEKCPQNLLFIALTAILSYKFVERPFLSLKEKYRPTV